MACSVVWVRSNADDLSPEGAEPRVTVAPSHAPVQEEEEEEEEEEIKDTDIQQKVCRSGHPLFSKALGSMPQSIIKIKFSSNWQELILKVLLRLDRNSFLNA